MFSRRKNLLEAFKRTSGPTAVPPPAPIAPPAARAAGPTLFDAPSNARAVTAGRGIPVALAGIAVVLAFTLGFAAGRGTQSARAADPEVVPEKLQPPANQPRSFQPPPAASPSSSEPATLEASALSDPKNLQTVVVASYTKSKSDLAWATYQHLKDANLPAFPPVETRNLVVVLAGAAPTAEELAKTLAGVRALSRDGKKNDYEDAYCARIDTLIPRPKKGTDNP